MSDTEAVRRAVERRVEAIAAKDAAAAVAVLDPKIVAFEVAGPLQIAAEEATDVAATQAWLDSFVGRPSIEIRDLAIRAEGNIAFCHSLNRLKGRMAGGREIDIEMRSTLCFRKKEGEWMIVHAHTSVPR